MKSKKREMTSFGQAVRDRRHELRLTQEFVSSELGYKTNSYVSDVELGKFIPNKEKLEKLGKALKWKKAEVQGVALQGRLEKLGFNDQALVGMLRDIPGMSKEEKQSMADMHTEAILKVRAKSQAKAAKK